MPQSRWAHAYEDMSELTSLKSLVVAFVGHIAAESAR